MTRSIDKATLFRELGYGPPFEALERALEEAGLSRHDKTGISPEKRAPSRGDCQAQMGDGDGRAVTPAATQADCAVCGGSAKARETVARSLGPRPGRPYRTLPLNCAPR